MTATPHSLPAHLQCFRDSGIILKTADGTDIKVWELITPSAEVVKVWAKIFRQNYCSDSDIDALRSGTGLSRKEFLEQLIFPDRSTAPGPSIRSGDFAELMITDYVQFIQNYWVPRMKYSEKATRNESIKGVDIVGFQRAATDSDSPKDKLLTFEVKAQATGSEYGNQLQKAVDDSSKDYIRIAQTLNATKRRLLERRELDNAKLVERFQNMADNPYIYKSGAAAVLTEEAFDELLIQSQTSVGNHQNLQNLELVVFRCSELMAMVHLIFDCAANEA